MPSHILPRVMSNDYLSFEEVGKIVTSFVNNGIDKIRLTGGEPLLRKNILSLVKKLRNENHLNDFSMTTNGIFLKKYARGLKESGLDRVNISLDTLDAFKYKKITKDGNLSAVMKGIEYARKYDLRPIKINVVLIKNFNDKEIEGFLDLTRKEDIEVRFIELMPFGNTIDFYNRHFISNQMVIERIKDLKAVSGSDKASTSVKYRREGYAGKIGLISPNSKKFCHTCNRVRLSATGRLKTCLHSNYEVDLKKHINDWPKLNKMLRNEILSKPKRHELEKGKIIQSNMTRIGG